MFNSSIKQEYTTKDGNLIVYKPVNARSMTIQFTGNYEVIKKDGKIILLDIYSEKIKIGQTIKITSSIYKYYYTILSINQIHIDDNVNTFALGFGSLTNTSNFILPSVAKNTWMTNHLINAYMYIEFDDLIIDTKNPSIYLYYRYSGSKSFYDFESMLNKSDIISQIINIDDLSLLVVAEIPDKFVDDYYLVSKSKYSEISDELKHNILNFYGYNNESVMANVLDRSEKRRDNLSLKYGVNISPNAELWDLMNIENETFGSYLLSEVEKTI